MHPGYSNVISTSLIHSRPLILAQNLPTPFFKKQKQKTRRNLRVMPRIAHRKYPYFPFSIPGRRNSDDLLTWIFAHFGKPHHHINSEKEIKTYVHWVEAYLPPEFSMNTVRTCAASSGAFLLAGCLFLWAAWAVPLRQLPEHLPSPLVLYILPLSEWKRICWQLFWNE